MKDLSAFPTAIRKGRQIEQRFKIQAERAYEKYKLEMELLERDKLKSMMLDEKEEDEYTGAMGMYIIETAKSTQQEGSDGSSQQTGISSSKGKEGILKYIVNIFKQKYGDTKFELKWKEFMCITFCLQVPISYLMRHIAMTLRWGALLVLIVYVLIGACIAMPVYMMLMFLGNYSRKSYIRFWECVPLMKGVSYSIAITSIALEFFSMSFAGMCLDYLYDIWRNKQVPWIDCKFADSNENCIDIYPKTSYNKTCCDMRMENCSRRDPDSGFLTYSTHDFYVSNQLQLGYGEEPLTSGIVWQWVFTVAVTWLLLFLLMALGIRRFRGFMTTINLIIGIIILVPLLGLTIIESPKYTMIYELDSNFEHLIDYKFWIETSVHSLHRELAGDVITFSAISSPGISTTVDTVCIYTLKFLFLVLFTVWMSIAVTSVNRNYKLVDPKCLEINEFLVVYSIFPDTLTRWHFPKIWLSIYFVVLFFWCFSGSVYTVNSFIGALFEEFPKLMKYRLGVCFCFCTICFTINIFVLTPNFLTYYKVWINDNYVHMKVSLLLFTLIGIYIYSIDRLANDYHFTYGKRLNEFWLHGVRVAMLLIMVITFLVLIFMVDSLQITNIIMTVVILSPILFGCVIAFLKYRSGVQKTLMDPDPKWGPSNFKKKFARNIFDPKRELRYRSTIQQCTHSCLLNSSTLENEIEYWRHKLSLEYDIDID